MASGAREARYIGQARPSAAPLPNKVVSAEQALANLRRGDVVLVGGQGGQGVPANLVDSLAQSDADELTIVATDADYEPLANIMFSGRCKRLIIARLSEKQRAANEQATSGLAIEYCPLGLLLERIRAAGVGLGGVLAPAEISRHSLGAERELVELKGGSFAIEPALVGNIALVKAWRGDYFGNLIYRGTPTNSNPIVATAAPNVLAEVDELFEPGDIDPAQVRTPGLTINGVVVAQ